MSEKNGFSCAKGLILGLVTAAIGVATLIGWALDVPVLKSVIPGMVSMKPNTAVGIILAGLSLALLACALRRGWMLVLSWLCAGAAGALGAIALCEFAIGSSLGIDQALFSDIPNAAGTLAPGRMAPLTAVSFMCVGVALILANLRRALRVVQTLALLTVVFGLLGLSARLYGAADLVGIGAGAHMALHTAVAFLLLSGGVLWLQPEGGVVRAVTDSSDGSWLLKRLVPFALAVPLLIGWVHVAGERRGYYSDPMGVALVTTVLSAALVALTWWAARALNRANDAVREHQSQLRQFVEHSPAAIAMFDRDMKYILTSRRWLTDYRIQGPVLGRSHYDVFPELPEALKEVHRRCLAGATLKGDDDPFPRADGTTDWIRWEARPWHTSRGDIGGIIILSEIVTEHKLAESRRELSSRVLAALNRTDDFTHLIRDLLHHIKEHTAVDAVAIRLREGEDFPYCEMDGFPDSFIKAANRLCTRGDDGRVMRDADGQAALECTCGRVLRGRTDASLPCYTPGGSFWSNSLSEVPPPQEGGPDVSAARHGGASAGYESVALIPLRSGSEIIGLLQLNDRRKGVFSTERVEFLEGIGESIGIAVTRRRTAESLRTAHARLRQFMDANIVGIVIASTSGRVLETNDYYLNTIGYTRAEFEQGSVDWRAITPPEWLSADEKAIAELRQHGTCTPYEKEYVRRDGSRVAVCLIDTMLAGQEEQVAAFVLDITERKRAEASLREKEERYRSLFEHMTNGFAYCRMEFEGDRPKDFVYLAVNPAFETQTGLRDVAGKRVSEVIPGICESDPDLIETYGRVASTGEPAAFETYVEALKSWFSISVYSPARGYFVAVFDVVTARKQAEIERAEMAQQRQLALDAARLGWWHYDPATKLSKWDDRYKEIFGVTGHAQPNEEILKRLHPEDLPRVWTAVEAALDPRNPVPYSAEYRIVLPNGDVRWIEAHGTAQFAGEGESRRATALVGTVEDITERKHIEQEREITISLLRLLTAHNDLRSLIKEVTALMQSWSGCEAVGVRLREGDDFPYFETRGFPAEFVEAERYLCPRDGSGAPVRDASGHAMLDCMCGNILCGRFDPKLSFFTQDGSFWSNCTTALLASTTEQQRQARTRNRCNSVGYESVALVPLRFGNETFGLLQLNDHRPNRFTAEGIRLIERLAASIAVGISQRLAESHLAASERKYRLLAENVSDVLWVLNLDTKRWEYVSPSVERLRGYTAAEVMAQSMDEVLTPESSALVKDRMAQRLARFNERPGDVHSYVDEVEQTCKDGASVWTEVATRYGRNEKGEVIVTGVSRNVSERKSAEQTLRDAETRYRLLFEQSPEGVVILDPETAQPIEFNEMAHRQLGYTREEFAQLSLAEIDASETPNETRARISSVLREGRKDFETLHRTKTGEMRNIFVTAQATEIAGHTVYHCLWRDITDRKQSEARRHELEAQLQHSQKMESVGRLAGGVAHDFNNILTGIGGYTELAADRLDEKHPAREDLAEVQRLAKRAADLTRQLLAFSRRQPLEPVVLNLNETVSDTTKMLKRVLGERIDLQFVPGRDLGNVRADAGQIEQILMNLAVNAHDAMSEGGRLTIETTNVDLDAEYAAHRIAVSPGPYVMLAVSDTGHGMDAATKARLFEPFFTTKEKGKGTGLGLATVYGIVKQHGGNIWVYSEPGKGATFKIYLPRVAEAATAAAPAPAPQTAQGHETILLVEDEASVRGFTERTLSARGYRILGAADAEEALTVFKGHPETISLLLTDVVLPGMNGRKLYDHLKAADPRLKVIYTSGYTDNAIVHQGVLDAGTIFIQKPFTADALARKVRQVLDT